MSPIHLILLAGLLLAAVIAGRGMPRLPGVDRAGRPAPGRHLRSTRPPPVRPLAPGPAQAADMLAGALTVHDSVHAAWTAYALDLHSVLDRPALSDVRDPLTQRFLTAQEEASALRPEAGTSPGPAHLDAYRRAVLELADSWDAAERHARELGISDMTEQERTSIRRAHLALNRVLDHRTPAAERMVAYRLVTDLLDGIIDLPEQGAQRLLKMIGPPSGDDGTGHQLEPGPGQQ